MDNYKTQWEERMQAILTAELGTDEHRKYTSASASRDFDNSPRNYEGSRHLTKASMLSTAKVNLPVQERRKNAREEQSLRRIEVFVVQP